MRFHYREIGRDQLLLCYGDRYCTVRVVEHIMRDNPDMVERYLGNMFKRMVADINRNDKNAYMLSVFKSLTQNFEWDEHILANAARSLIRMMDDDIQTR